MMQNNVTYTVKTPQGQTHQIEGNPTRLTLRQALGEIGGKTGGEVWTPGSSGVRFRVNGKTYGDTDLERSFSELGITQGSTIEVLEGQPA